MSHKASTKLYETKCPRMHAPADHLGSPLFSWDFPHSCTCRPNDQGNITVSLPHNLSGKSTVMSVSTLTSKSCRNHNKILLLFWPDDLWKQDVGNQNISLFVSLHTSRKFSLFPLQLLNNSCPVSTKTL